MSLTAISLSASDSRATSAFAASSCTSRARRVVLRRHGSANTDDEDAGLRVRIFCGIDWAEDHHDIAVVDEHGTQLTKLRISDDAAGYATLLGMLGQHGEHAENLTPVAIETGRGLLVACLAASGWDGYVINPMAAARYRKRTMVARSKFDAVDALMLANVLHTHRHTHRPMPRRQ